MKVSTRVSHFRTRRYTKRSTKRTDRSLFIFVVRGASHRDLSDSSGGQSSAREPAPAGDQLTGRPTDEQWRYCARFQRHLFGRRRARNVLAPLPIRRPVVPTRPWTLKEKCGAILRAGRQRQPFSVPISLRTARRALSVPFLPSSTQHHAVRRHERGQLVRPGKHPLA